MSTQLALSSFVRRASLLRGVRWLGRHRAEYKLTANLGEERLHNAKMGPEIDHTDVLMSGGVWHTTTHIYLLLTSSFLVSL